MWVIWSPNKDKKEKGKNNVDIVPILTVVKGEKNVCKIWNGWRLMKENKK